MILKLENSKKEMKKPRYLDLLDRNFNLLENLTTPQFQEMPREIQYNWLEKSCFEVIEEVAKVNGCIYARVALHFILGAILEISDRMELQENLIAKIEAQQQAKRAIDCQKTLKAYFYLKKLADRVQLPEREFLENYCNIYLSALYLLSSVPDSQLLTDEVIDHLKRGFLLDKATADAFIEVYLPNVKPKRICPNDLCGIAPYKKLGEKVRHLRLDNQLTLLQLGEKIGLAEVSIFRIEKGDRRLDAVELWLVAKTFAERSQEFKILAECLEKVLR